MNISAMAPSVCAITYPRHRQEESIACLSALDAYYPPAFTDIVAICDNLAVYKTARVQEQLAIHLRWRFVFTPTHASWLNQIEIWFGILQRKPLRHGQFLSIDDLAA